MSVPILHYPFSIFHLGNDGLLDGYEVQNGTDPLNPDTDNDDIPDGWSLEQYAAHRLLNGEEGDRTITITLQASTPASNRAVQDRRLANSSWRSKYMGFLNSNWDSLERRVANRRSARPACA